MSRCYICDKILEKPIYNRMHQDWDPCPSCLEVIYSVFSDFPDDFETGEASNNPEDMTEEVEDSIFLLDNLEDLCYTIS